MNPPFADPWKMSRRAHRVRDAALLTAAFGVGVACGLAGVAVVFGRDLFNRLPR